MLKFTLDGLQPERKWKIEKASGSDLLKWYLFGSLDVISWSLQIRRKSGAYKIPWESLTSDASQLKKKHVHISNKSQAYLITGSPCHSSMTWDHTLRWTKYGFNTQVISIFAQSKLRLDSTRKANGPRTKNKESLYPRLWKYLFLWSH